MKRFPSSFIFASVVAVDAVLVFGVMSAQEVSVYPATHVITTKVELIRDYDATGGRLRDERVTTTHTFASKDSSIVVSTNIVSTNTTALTQPVPMR